VASYLTLDLYQDWRYGAHHFEEVLIDHDVQSNYGSWNFSAGIGPGRTYNFNTIKQSKDFDSEGKFIKMWCPELASLPLEFVHEPWKMKAADQEKYGVILGETYPKPIDCPKYLSSNAYHPPRKQSQPWKMPEHEESKSSFSQDKPKSR